MEATVVSYHFGSSVFVVALIAFGLFYLFRALRHMDTNSKINVIRREMSAEVAALGVISRLDEQNCLLLVRVLVKA
jgi:hypothetical protein